MYIRDLTSEDMLCAAELMTSYRKSDTRSLLWKEWIRNYCEQSKTRLLAGAFDGSQLAAVMAAGYSNSGGGADDGCIEIHGYWAGPVQKGVYPSSQLILFVFNQFEAYRPKKVVLYNTPHMQINSIDTNQVLADIYDVHMLMEWVGRKHFLDETTTYV